MTFSPSELLPTIQLQESLRNSRLTRLFSSLKPVLGASGVGGTGSPGTARAALSPIIPDALRHLPGPGACDLLKGQGPHVYFLGVKATSETPFPNSSPPSTRCEPLHPNL